MKEYSTKVMASGNLCMELSNSIGWDEFAPFAEKVASSLDASIVDKADTVEVRVWELSFSAGNLKLTYDDFPQSVSLESPDEAGDKLLHEIEERLNTGHRLT